MCNLEDHNFAITVPTVPLDNMTLSQIIREQTNEFILSGLHNHLSEEMCVSELLYQINSKISEANHMREKVFQLRLLKELPLLSVEMLIGARDDVALIAPGGKSQTGKKKFYSSAERLKLPVALYQEDGDNKGIWQVANEPYRALGTVIEKYKPGATQKEKREIFANVKNYLRVVEKCSIPYYVPVNNGIVDVLNKQLYEFSPDFVFTAKIHTNYNPNAVNPFIQIPEDGTTWDVDSWLSSLGTPTFVYNIKEVIQAACLPLAPRSKMCLFYSQVDNSEKSTICQLIRNLLGEKVTVSIPINSLSNRFWLSKLPGAMAIITDENNVSSLGKEISMLKAVITGDSVTVERMYQNPFDFVFNGLVLQCVNDMPKGDNKTTSFQRILHIIPFEHCFTGQQKRYIKDRLIHRNDVLEYILKMVLIDMPYRDSFTETPETKAALELYISVANSVANFLDVILPQCKWDLLPATDFLYAMYKEWYKKNSPSGEIIGRNDFIDGVKEYTLTNTDEWEWTDCTRSHGYIRGDVREPLLVEYDLRAFQNEACCFTNPQKGYACEWKLKEKYSGLKRRNVAGAVDD